MRSNREWLSISDMMAGLMMVFLFIAIVFMQQIGRDKDSLVKIASTYANTKSKLNTALHDEFDKDLIAWGAEILPDNTVRFKEPNVLFNMNSLKIKDSFKKILTDFFPRYLGILTSNEFRNDIIELRVEGHTSSKWKDNSSLEAAYLGNAYISQGRAFSVLDYLFRLKSTEIHQPWLIQVFRANGLSFAKRILTDEKEDRRKSRRVEFRVITNTEARIEEILRKSQKQSFSL